MPRALSAVRRVTEDAPQTEAERLAANVADARAAVEATQAKLDAARAELDRVTALWRGKERAALEAFETAPESTDELRKAIKDARADAGLEIDRQNKFVATHAAAHGEAVAAAQLARKLELEHLTSFRLANKRAEERGARAGELILQILAIEAEAEAEARELQVAYTELAALEHYPESRSTMERTTLGHIASNFLTRAKRDSMGSNGPVDLALFRRFRRLVDHA